MVTGFMKLNGITVGAVANRCEVYNDEGEKTASFDAALSPAGCDKAAEIRQLLRCLQHSGAYTDQRKRLYGGQVLRRRLQRLLPDLHMRLRTQPFRRLMLLSERLTEALTLLMNSKAIGADTDLLLAGC